MRMHLFKGYPLEMLFGSGKEGQFSKVMVAEAIS